MLAFVLPAAPAQARLAAWQMPTCRALVQAISASHASPSEAAVTRAGVPALVKAPVAAVQLPLRCARASGGEAAAVVKQSHWQRRRAPGDTEDKVPAPPLDQTGRYNRWCALLVRRRVRAACCAHSSFLAGKTFSFTSIWISGALAPCTFPMATLCCVGSSKAVQAAHSVLRSARAWYTCSSADVP